MKHRILAVVGTRPRAVEMAPVVHALRAAPWAECCVLATAQHRQLIDETLAFFGITLGEPLDYPDMVAAMRACTLILMDSGGVQEEAPSLGKPVLVLRGATERYEGVAAEAALLVGPDRERIVQVLQGAISAPAPA
jgi:UDP-N-acetylglucosamine 2-epimerase